MSDAILRFVGQEAGLDAQFRRANQSLKTLEQNSERTSSLINKGFQAVAGIVGAISFVRLAQEAFEFAEQLEITSARTGIQIEALQRLQFIATQSESSIEAITSSINKFQVNLVEGNDKAIKGLGRLGLSITELNALQPEQQFLRIAESIADLQSPAERAATAIEIFGRGGAELLPLLNKGADAIRELDVQFDQFGVTLSSETVHKVDDAGDAIGRMTGAVKSLGVELLSIVAMPIAETADGITLFFKSLAFGLRGEGGGHGENVISNIDRDIELLTAKVKRLSDAKFVGSGLFSRDLADLIQAQAHLDALLARQRELLDLGPSVLQKIGVDAAGVQLGKSTTTTLQKFAEANRELTPQEKRQQSLGRDNNPVVIQAVEEKDLLLQINQEKLDELLRQETDASLKSRAIESDLAEFKRSVRETFGLQEITFEEGKNATLLSVASGLFGALARENSKVAKIQQALAIATTIWDTSRAVMKALAEVPYPANFGIAALIAAQGAIQIAKIKSTNYGGGGGSVASISGGGSASGTANAPAVNEVAPAGATQGSVLQVTVQGVITEAAVREIFDLAGEMADGGFVFINQGTTQAQLIREGS